MSFQIHRRSSIKACSHHSSSPQGVYHDYGLKHVVLLLVLILYACTWAVIFVVVERPHELAEIRTWKERAEKNRSSFAHRFVKEVFNNTDYYCRLSGRRSDAAKRHFKRFERDVTLQKLSFGFFVFLNFFENT